MAAQSVTVRDFTAEIPGKLSNDRTNWKFPPIESVTSRGKKTTWKIRVKLFRAEHPNSFIPIEDAYFKNNTLPDDYRGWIKVDFFYGEGLARASVPTIVKSGKNKGKSSETNVFCQALRDALSAYNGKLKRAARAGTEVEMIPPMLAQIYKPGKADALAKQGESVWLQTKYNGIRAVAVVSDGAVLMYSRRKNIFPGLHYIKSEIADVLNAAWARDCELYLDGEIYKAGMPLQEISGISRRDDDGVKLNYYIYDCFVANQPELVFSERNALLGRLFKGGKYCRLAATVEARSDAAVQKEFRRNIKNGEEGIMVRLNRPYRYSYGEYHSNVLLKLKPELDGEYKIVGWETGKRGSAAHALMIICVTEGGKQFTVTPALEIPERVAMARKMCDIEANGKIHFENHWWGKKLIVFFDELSKDKVPLRARTKMTVRTWD